MKHKFFMSMLLAGSLVAGAQSQGYKDGIEYYKAGQYDNARTILERTLNDASTDKALANYYLGQSYLAQGDKAKAVTFFKQGVNINPDEAFNYVGLGAVDLLNGALSQAEENFKTARKLGKKNAEVSVGIARAYYNADAVKYAKEIEKNLAQAAKDSKNAEPAIYILRGDMAYDQKNYGDAAMEYEQAINAAGNSTEGFVKFANSYFYVNPKLAIQRLEELLTLQPNSALAQRELAEKYYEGKYWKKAAEQYGNYIQNPNHFPEDKARYSVLLYWGEDYEPSLAVANDLLAQNPDNFLMQRMRFLNETALGRYQDAVRDAQSFFDKNPGAYFTTNDFVKYAEALSGINQDSLAVVQYELAVKNAPENKALLKDLSDMYTKNKDFRRAAEAYDAYVQSQENPSVQDLYGMSARYLNIAATATDDEERQNAGQRGLEYIDKVIARAEPQPALYQRKARLNIAKNGNRPNAEAIAAYDKMLELLDADPENKKAGSAALNQYKEAYMFQMAFYSSSANKDDERHAQATANLNEVNALLNGDAQ
ncbi:MAG: tetratricopeptide repeat protein [Muribaculaceae bacterium]|nr:tetratricopeptide repeat protein [Muribaculaceae bacterium]